MQHVYNTNNSYLLLSMLAFFITATILFIKSDYSVLIIISILVIGLLYFILDSSFKDFRDNNGSFVDTLIALIATLFGVYAALFATSKQTDKDNREVIRKLSETVQSDLKIHSKNFKNGAILITEKYKNDNEAFAIYQDSTKKSGYQFVPEFKSCDLLSNSDLFLRYANKEILINLMSFDKMLKASFQYANFESFKSTQEYARFVQSIVDLLDVVDRIIDIQVKEIKKVIKPNAAINEMKSIIYNFSHKFKTKNVGGVYVIDPRE